MHACMHACVLYIYMHACIHIHMYVCIYNQNEKPQAPTFCSDGINSGPSSKSLGPRSVKPVWSSRYLPIAQVSLRGCMGEIIRVPLKGTIRVPLRDL